MIALQGIYENGTIKLENPAPVEKANVIVVFPDVETEKKNEIVEEEARNIFKKYTGSISRIIDEEVEKVEAIDEKYESIG